MSSKVHHRDDNQYLDVLGSESSSCGKTQIKLLEWKDCDTIPKKIGFLFGKVVNTLVTAGQTFWNNTVSILKLDKITKFFFDFLKIGYNKISFFIEKTIEFVSNVFTSISNNNLVKKIKSHFYTYIFNPITDGISKLARFIFKTILWEKICLPVYERVIKPCCCKVREAKRSIAIDEDASATWCIKVSETLQVRLAPLGRGLKTLANWTIVPIYNHIISPVLKAIGDTIHALISGIYRKNNAPTRKEDPIEGEVLQVVEPPSSGASEAMPHDIGDDSPTS